MRREVAMDNFLTALGLFRKRLAKDGFCLFRAVSEQYWTELDAMQTLSRIYKSCLDTSGSSNTSGEAETDDRIKRNRGRRVTPPVPYRIAKALDPYVYRNTELDIWEEEKREAIHRERYKFVTFSVGDKCQNPMPSSNQLTVQTPYPRIWVPFMDDVALGQVDVNCPPSQDSTGKDLPSHGENIFVIKDI
ncbi:hypothetical protein FSP39_004738 [Pinctada imbricata]|uniref:Uncharacterized protein n=1 Tax=Pinctada imbricata TaxID=66713 RepID=A0AA88Y6E5_PINIB|nr:hypothetical protein FSP39_004738 [Pinctada imbricata]